MPATGRFSLNFKMSMPNINTEYIGQDFDDFLQDEGLTADVEALAIEKVVVAFLKEAGYG
jgi:hypothetical protein